MKKYIEIIKATLKKITFKGRSGREDYLTFIIFNFLFSVFSLIFFLIPVMVLCYKIAVKYGNIGLNDIPVDMNSIAIYCLIAAIFFVPVCIWIAIAHLCLAVRRTHDFNYSGWLYFAFLVVVTVLSGIKDSTNILSLISGILSLIQVIVYCSIKGTQGENKYSLPESQG